MLAVDAIHPKLVRPYDSLINIADKKPDLLTDHPLLSIYLATQLNTLRYRDVMFAHDFSGNPKRLITYAEGEMREVAEVIPWLNHNYSVSDFDPAVASREGGDVAWFLAMRVGLHHLHEDYRMNSEEMGFVVGMIGILENISKVHPDFDPASVAVEVAQKNEQNYPSRVLRADPAWSIDEMSEDFAEHRLRKLKAFRSKLRDRKIPTTIYSALENGVKQMPRVPEAKRGAIKLYTSVAQYAHEAATHYNYDGMYYDGLGWQAL
ncbi:MAG: hypothetical protein WCL07_03575 [bacterium]